jgi:hypothetical protein
MKDLFYDKFVENIAEMYREYDKFSPVGDHNSISVYANSPKAAFIKLNKGKIKDRFWIPFSVCRYGRKTGLIYVENRYIKKYLI